MPPPLKPVRYVGRALKELNRFPDTEREDALYQIRRVRQGKMPMDFDSMQSVGPGTYEIRLDGDGLTYRVFYVAKFEEAVYVLHCFNKKSRHGKATPREHIETGKRRYKAMLLDRPR